MTRPRLLLVPFVTAIEWERITPLLEEWAEIATFDAPGVGDEPLPAELDIPIERWDEREDEALALWREATARRAIEEADRRGWDGYYVVGDSYGIRHAVRLAVRDRERVLGLALGHAALSHDREGPRAPMSKEIWDAMTALMRTDTSGFIAYGMAQMTQGAVTEEEANRWLERFPDSGMVTAIWGLLGEDPEPVGKELHALDLPMLLAQHVGCLSETQEGYDDILAEFPDAATIGCPEACASSPTFAEALQRFCRGAAAA